MLRIHHALALITLLGSAPLAAPAFAAGPGPATSATPAPMERSLHATAPGSATSVDMSSPATPIPMNLPDDATADEVNGQYGVGLAGLILGTLLVAAFVIGGFYIFSRRTWSTSH